MKKIFFSVFLIFVLGAKTFGADYYSVGIDAYKKGAYEKALSNLEHAVRINPKNVSARYYLAQVYLRQQMIPEAQEQYNRIILLAPDSDAGRLSQKGLYYIRQAQSNTGKIASFDQLGAYRDNYLDYVLSNSGDANKWAAFPVRVYIEPKPQKAAVIKAFNQWQNRSNKLVSFTFVNSPQQAQITVDFKDKLESTSTKESFIAGYSKPYYQGVHIVKSEINILGINPETGAAQSNDFITATALHELGHSLGFIGHSPNENDVMYASSKDAKLELTQRDLNTLNLFYKIDGKALQARAGSQSNVKFQEALDYVKKSPDKAVGWMNLADLYRDKKMYSNAIANYRKAISLEPDNANAHALLGETYISTGDKQNAYLSLKKACDLDTTNKYYLSRFIKVCSMLGKNDEAKKYTEAFGKLSN